MDHWEKFNETSLPEKADFYNNLNMEDITDADYDHAKRVGKDFVIYRWAMSQNLPVNNFEWIKYTYIKKL